MNTGVENTTRNGRSGLSLKDPDSLALAFEERWPRSEWADDVVLVGVSGGVDSIALLELIVRFAPDLDRVKVLHCNHGLRGEESDGDESFVIEHCLDRGVECLSIRVHASELVSTSEDALRRIRSRHYIETAKHLGARWIALGHHRDDNLETFFLRLFRGSGPRGLAGIPERRAVSKANHKPIELVRPLLSVPKKDLEEWLIHHGISFREDSSNRQAPYQRNRLRHELIPVLDNLYGPGWRKHVLQLMGSMSQQTEEQAAKARGILDQCWKGEGETERVVIPLTTLLGEEWDVSREMILAIWHDKGWSLRPWTKKHWDRLQVFFLDASETTHPRRLDLPGKIRVLVRRGNVYFEPITDS